MKVGRRRRGIRRPNRHPKVANLLDLPQFTRLATRDLGVAHVLGARAGLIDDRSPNKTVRNIFDVAKQTVQAWVRTEVNSPGWATSLIQQANEMPDRADEISKLLDIRRNPVIRRMK